LQAAGRQNGEGGGVRRGRRRGAVLLDQRGSLEDAVRREIDDAAEALHLTLPW
jgi:hypothetical protein